MATSTARRPVPIEPITGTPQDDGLFGPGSVTWRVFASPAESVGATAAVLVQMLLPRVAWNILQSSAVYSQPELRARLTAEYGLTVTFGDTASAERAGGLLRNIHHHKVAVDPQTGETYRASEPELLLYVHNVTLWGLLRGCDRWGPKLTPEEKDRFVAEQRAAARLVGVDPAAAPSTLAELDAYMARMRPGMACTVAARTIRDLFVEPGSPRDLPDIVNKALAFAAVDLLTPEQRALYGMRRTRLHRLMVDIVAALAIAAANTEAPYAKAVPKLREYVVTHAFGRKVRDAKARARTVPPAGHLEEPIAGAASSEPR